ncbi:MAG: dehydrogenase [Chloroflexi bacterium HGW-Chloroflexi-4]|nr:MAG: dehydrogenase [Chloroflexi bacterium HGW-Chloroflexi-4]
MVERCFSMNNEYFEIDYPSSRQLTFDVGKIGLGKHHVKALLEVDVSEPWRILIENRKVGKKISFITWLIKLIADCVSSHPPVAGINEVKKNKVLVFKDVDVSIVIEKEVNGIKVPLPYVIRRADKKTYEEIQKEIETAKQQKVENETDYVLGQKSSLSLMKVYTSLPQWLRLVLMRILVLNHPKRTKQNMGSVMITTVGMVGHTHGWIIPYSMHPVCLALGSINEQPVIKKGEIKKAHILHLAILVDHDVIDGIPAAVFVDDLVRKMEKGMGLESYVE